MEIWRDIEGYEGMYQVSNEGRVRSLDRTITFKDGRKRIFKGQILKQQLANNYNKVDLQINKYKHSFNVHRLVAAAFIPNPENLSDVNHKDENKLNNKCSNLEWISHIDNCNYGDRNEKVSISQGKRVMCVETGIEYHSISFASKQCNICIDCISKCCKGKRKTAGGLHWRYV